MNIITDQLPPKLDKNSWVGIDLEIFDLNEKQMHRPTSGRFALLSIAHEDDVYVIDDEKKVAPALEKVGDAWWIIQNAKFDLAHLRRWANILPRKRLFDTMIIDRILYGGYYDTFSLDDLARRHLNIHVEKELQKSFTGGSISREQLEYAAKDAWLLPKIAEKQRERMDKKDFHIWMDIDRPALFAFLDFPGFAINVDAWEQLAIRNKSRQEAIDMTLPINPRSPKQVVQYLRDHGIKIDSSGKEVLEKLEEKMESIEEQENNESLSAVKGILESRKFGTRASRYGLNFISDFLEYDNGIPVICANYWTTGADTGRTASDDPNMQNIPARDTNEFRECFIARPDHKLVVVDYSQQEVLIVAYISDDKRLKEICNSGQDIYIQMAKTMYNIDIDKKHPLRKRMKSVVLGTNYGMSEFGLARKENISVDEAKEVLFVLRKKFPRLSEWMESQQSKKNYVETVAGRKYWLNPYNNKSGRNALNSPVQGSAGDCMKAGLAHLHQSWVSNIAFPFSIVGYIHDELVSDVPAEWANDVARYKEKVLIDVANEMFPGMNFRAEAVIGDNWGCKT